MPYVKFDEIKAAISLEQVLEHYGVSELKQRGKSRRGDCPICGGTDYCFSANFEKNCWQCFYCQRSGNIFDLVGEMEGIARIREVGVFIGRLFNVGIYEKKPVQKKVSKPKKESDESNPPKSQEDEPTEEMEINPVLDFKLKNISHQHEALQPLGLSEKILKEFGIGYYIGRGMLRNRIVFPIHNASGGLVAYGSLDPDKPGEYCYPDTFRPEFELYNLYSAAIMLQHSLILVEHPLDAAILSYAHVDCAVALMGSGVSDTQVQLLREHIGTGHDIDLVLSEKLPGVADIISKLIPHFHVRLLRFPEKEKSVLSFTTEEAEIILS